MSTLTVEGHGRVEPSLQVGLDVKEQTSHPGETVVWNGKTYRIRHLKKGRECFPKSEAEWKQLKDDYIRFLETINKANDISGSTKISYSFTKKTLTATKDGTPKVIELEKLKLGKDFDTLTRKIGSFVLEKFTSETPLYSEVKISDTKQPINTVKAQLNALADDLRSKYPGKTWSIESNTKAHQADGVHCGHFVLNFIQAVVNGQNPEKYMKTSFDQKDLPTLKKNLADFYKGNTSDMQLKTHEHLLAETPLEDVDVVNYLAKLEKTYPHKFVSAFIGPQNVAADGTRVGVPADFVTAFDTQYNKQDENKKPLNEALQKADNKMIFAMPYLVDADAKKVGHFKVVLIDFANSKIYHYDSLGHKLSDQENTDIPPNPEPSATAPISQDQSAAQATVSGASQPNPKDKTWPEWVWDLAVRAKQSLDSGVGSLVNAGSENTTAGA